LRGTGDDAEAVRVGRQALALAPDDATPCHRLWLVADDVLAGRHEAVGELAQLDASGFDNLHRFIHELVECVADLDEAPPPERGQMWQEVRQRLTHAAHSCAPLVEDRPAARRMYRRCVRRLARHGGPTGALWGMWRRLRPLLPAATS
jgi:hypothetical protein